MYIRKNIVRGNMSVGNIPVYIHEEFYNRLGNLIDCLYIV